MLLEQKFGTVLPATRKKIERLTSEEREQIVRELLRAATLKELGL
jgi:hypothetical protein